ncbi:Mut7-C RNAse domain-containing protein [Sulfuriflexus mobilis]|uniref:Mut7-C RNAse domain-containing protein n=1 Tax=Sulfuriflexus mobilis TaxID=1811807 RepID=UPI000F83403C|nr:Mut7-C RNAse domain-containing protein [Sulfuriflexus mobilis]
MKHAIFHFHANLNDFLSAEQVDKAIPYQFSGRPAIKDAIEAIGVPHTEVAVILVNGDAVNFSYGLYDGDDVHVYPHAEHPEVARQYLHALLPTGQPAFVLDVHLGKLARYLRTAGFDTLYSSDDMGDASIADIAEGQGRIVVSRDIGLLKRSRIRYGYWPRQTEARAQFRELVSHYKLKPLFRPFSRCPQCNGEVGAVDKARVSDSLPGKVASDPLLEDFVQCHDCGQVYWRGSHYTHMQHFFDSV